MIIDIFQDTVCPWCRIGKEHLRLALVQWDDEDVTIRLHPFFLDPTVPLTGHAFKQYLLAKGGGRISLDQFFERPRQAGERIGMAFNFEAIDLAPNTLLSHRLWILSPDKKQEAILDDIYQAYFEDGKNIGDIEILVDIGVRHGWGEEDIRAKLQSNEGEQTLMAEVIQAQHLGVTGVPFFVFNGKFALSGAQPPEIMLKVLDQAAQFVSK